MKLYKIHQNTNSGYDTYDSAVVAAENEATAAAIHPDGYSVVPMSIPSMLGESWTTLDRVQVEEIGLALEGIKAGVIVASYNAG